MPKRDSFFFRTEGPIKKEELLQKIKEELDREHPQPVIDSDTAVSVTLNGRSVQKTTPDK